MMTKQIQIRMKTLDAGPQGVIQPGQVISVSAKEAEDLIKGGYAEPYGSAAETASIKPSERAARPKSKPKTPDPTQETGPEAELIELVGKKPGKALIEAGINSITAALEAIEAGVDLREISGVGRGAMKTLSNLKAELGDSAADPDGNAGDDGGSDDTDPGIDEDPDAGSSESDSDAE
jgi:hypothetical protein